MSENNPSKAPCQKITQGFIEYSINEEEKTASITECRYNVTELHIPRSIKYKSNEYIVTSISNYAFAHSEVKTILFAPNSKLRTIGKEAFTVSLVTRILIPASTVELDERCFIGALCLTHVEVDPGNARYLSVGWKYVIGKSDIAKEDYDTLVFWDRDLTEANIPSTIKIIGTSAFEYSELTSILIPAHVTQIRENAFASCRQLSRVEFEPNSELQTIEKKAFAASDITEILIPAHVTQIRENAFSDCEQLSRVEFEPNSELQTIEGYTFSDSGLTDILIPAHVTKICNRAFYGCRKLSGVEFEPNSELRTIEQEAFKKSSLERIQIPASAVELEEGSLALAKNLKHVEVDPGNAQYSSVGGKYIISKSDIACEDYDTLFFWTRDSIEANIPSTIKIIGAGAFAYSKLTSILIPAHVTQICECAFYKCRQLSRVEFEPNSELRTIGYSAFSITNVTRIKIPASTVELEGCFTNASNLTDIEVDPGNARYSSVGGKCIICKSDIACEVYDTLVFCAPNSIEVNIPSTIKIIGASAFEYSKLTSILIPANVTLICECAFANCGQLSRVEFEPNSELQKIEGEAFSHSNIKRILIPARVTQICKSAFSNCKQLSRVEFEPNSELQKIEGEAFSYTKLTSILIPAHVTKIGKLAFYCCELQIVELEDNSAIVPIVNGNFYNYEFLTYQARKTHL